MTFVSLKDCAHPQSDSGQGSGGEGSTEVCPPTFLIPTSGFSWGLQRIQSTFKSPSAVTQNPQGSQGPDLAYVTVLRGFHPHPARHCPTTPENKDRGSGVSKMSVHGQLCWLVSLFGALPAYSGQPLAHVLIGHATNGRNLKEAARTEGGSAGTPR